MRATGFSKVSIESSTCKLGLKARVPFSADSKADFFSPSAAVSLYCGVCFFDASMSYGSIARIGEGSRSTEVSFSPMTVFR